MVNSKVHKGKVLLFDRFRGEDGDGYVSVDSNGNIAFWDLELMKVLYQ